MELNGYEVGIWDDTSGDYWEFSVDAQNEARAIIQAIGDAGLVSRDVKEALVDGSDWVKIRGRWMSAFVAAHI